MNPEQIIEFIRQQLIEGKSRPEIEQTLRINNVSENEMAVAFNAAEWQKNQNFPAPKHRSHRGLAWLSGILTLLLLATGAAAYVLVFQPDLAAQWLNQIPPPASTPPSSLPKGEGVSPISSPLRGGQEGVDTTNWKTYINNKYGFEFKYPAGWTADNELKLDSTFFITGPKKGVGDVGGDQINFDLDSNTQKLALSIWLKNNVGFDGQDEKIIVGNVDGIRRTGIGQISGERAISIFFAEKDRVFSFSAVGLSNISTLDQILSTFRFTATSTPSTS